jgi:hypothetical protein
MPKKPPPKFKVGDKVTSHRGEKATVTRVRHVEDPGKSHRVGVKWDSKSKPKDDAVDYYEHVFHDRRKKK